MKPTLKALLSNKLPIKRNIRKALAEQNLLKKYYDAAMAILIVNNMSYEYHGIEYIPAPNGVAEKVKCPLVDNWVSDIDCLENQSVAESCIPARFKEKKDWQSICRQCPFRDY